MARNTSHSKLPSNARVRRELHQERAAVLRTRKRLRRQRYMAQLEAVMQAKEQLEVAAELDAAAEEFSYRATDVKIKGEGWEVQQLAGDGTVVGTTYAPSRDKARGLARDQNAST